MQERNSHNPEASWQSLMLLMTVICGLLSAVSALLLFILPYSMEAVGRFLVLSGSAMMTCGIYLTGTWHSRRTVLTATALGIMPALLYPAGFFLILDGFEAPFAIRLSAGILLTAAWIFMAYSAWLRCRDALSALEGLRKLEARDRAKKDIQAAHASGAANQDERIALALIAWERSSEDTELIREYRDVLSEYAISNGRGPSYYADLCNDLLMKGMVSGAPASTYRGAADAGKK